MARLGRGQPNRPIVQRTMVAIDASLTTSVVSAVASVPAPTVGAGAGVFPATVAAVAIIPTPTVSVGSVETVEPSTVAAVASVPSPTLHTGSQAHPSTVQVTALVPTPAVRTSSIVRPAVVLATAQVPLPTVGVPILPGDLITGDWQIEYGGLLFGAGSYLIQAGSVTGWDDQVDLDSGNVLRPSRHGAWSGRSLAQERTVSATLLVYDLTPDFMDTLRALRRALGVPDDETETALVIRTLGETLVCYGKPDARVIPTDYYGQGHAAVAVRWRCSDPRRYGLSVTSVVIAVGATGSATNAGDTAEHPLVRFAGPVTNPVVTNLTTGRQLAFNTALGTTQTLSVDCNAGTATVGGVDWMSALAPLSVPPEEWYLAAGLNVISYSASSGGSNGMDVQFRSAYL